MSEIINQLIDGNKEFKKKYFSKENSLYNALVQYGQKPKVMVIACSDSRVDPAMIFECKPGELFVVRNVANLIPPCEENNTYHGTSAALEFGTCFLEVEHIIILGHTQCGGIQALIECNDKIFKQKPDSFIPKWMNLARPAYEKVITTNSNISFEGKVILCEKNALINSLNNLLTFPWLKERVTNKKLSIHAWYFNLATGLIHVYKKDADNWEIL